MEEGMSLGVIWIESEIKTREFERSKDERSFTVFTKNKGTLLWRQAYSTINCRSVLPTRKTRSTPFVFSVIMIEDIISL